MRCVLPGMLQKVSVSQHCIFSIKKTFFQVHGKPIPVQQKSPADQDFEKHVDELHARAIDAIKDIYLRHRDIYG